MSKSKRRNFRTPEEAFAARTERRGECLIWTGATDSHGYGAFRCGGKMTGVHRYAWERENGPIPKGKIVDHRDHCDRACVEVRHLRLATVPQNISNRSGPTKGNKATGVRNVRPNGKGFMVRVKGKYVGTYSTVEEAAKVAEQKRRDLFGEFGGNG